MKRIPLFLVVIAGVLSLLAASALAAASPPVNSSPPAIAGTAQNGHTLTASNGTWTGLAPISYTYQWQRCNSSGSSCTALASATNQNYVASSGDVGKTIRVEVTGTNADGKSQALSAATAAITPAGSAPGNTKQPNSTGTAQEGKTVTVDHGTWSGVTPIKFTYQWQSCTNAATSVCTDVAGMTSSSFKIGSSQIGTLLRATIVATNSIGATSALSNLSTIVLAKASAPINVSLPAISGSAIVGQTLAASTGTWNGGTTGFGYQWSRCNANGSGCSGISGATGQSYGVGQADLGLSLRVSVKATNAIGSTSATSASLAIPVRVVKTASFRSVLRAGQEVSRPSRVPSRAIGHFSARVSGKTLHWTLTFSHLSGRPTIARLHRGVRYANGVAFTTLCRSCRSTTRGTLTLTAGQLDAMLHGRVYVNVRTRINPRGEIRGQISRVS